MKLANSHTWPGWTLMRSSREGLQRASRRVPVQRRRAVHADAVDADTGPGDSTRSPATAATGLITGSRPSGQNPAET